MKIWLITKMYLIVEMVIYLITSSKQVSNTQQELNLKKLSCIKSVTICRVIPVTRGSCVKPCSVLLHDHAGHDVLERLLELCQTG